MTEDDQDTETIIYTNWKDQMEDHLRGVRECSKMVGGGLRSPELKKAYATMAQAHATAALALATAHSARKEGK